MEKFLKDFESPEKIFLVICFFWGLLFMLVNPPFQGSDEDSHLYKIYGFTQGSLNFKKLTVTTNDKYGREKLTFGGQILPQGLIEASRANKAVTFNPNKKTSVSETVKISKIPLDKENKVFLAHPFTPYTPLSYMPAVFVIWFMTLFSASPFAMLAAGRLCSLFVYLVCGYFAIKITPVKKWMLLSILLIPTAVYQSSVLGTDAFTFGIVMLLCAYSLRLAYAKEVEKIDSKQNLIFLTLVAMVGITKFTYLPLVFLYLLIPREKFIYEKQRILSFLIILCSAVFITLCFVIGHLYITNDLVPYSTSISGADSMKFILSHPFEYLFMILKTLILNLVYYLNGVIGIFGWSDTFLPLWGVFVYIFILVYTGAVNLSGTEFKGLDTKNKAVLVLIGLFSVILVCTSCFTVFEPDMKNHIINWIQGRYFLPLMPLFLLYLSKGGFETFIHDNVRISKLVVIILINFVLLVSFITVIKRFYI